MMIVMTENIEPHVCLLHVHSTLAAMTVGFTSMSYTARETKRQATVCVYVINPPNGGALQNFSVALLPARGVFLQKNKFLLRICKSDTASVSVVCLSRSPENDIIRETQRCQLLEA